MAKDGGTRRRRRAIAAVAAAVAAAGAAAALLARPAPIRIGFYDVDARLAASTAKAVDAWAERTRARAEYATLAGLDAASLKAVDAVILYPSTANSRSAGSFAAVPAGLAERVSISLRKASEAAGKNWCLPLLVDTQELDWRKDAFSKSPAQARLGVAALKLAAMSAKAKATASLVIGGGDDATLLDAAGLLVLERGGAAAYGKLVSAAAGKDAAAALSTDLGGFDLRSAVEPLASLRNEGALHPDWLSFKEADTTAFLTEGLAALSLQSLSIRRTVPYEAIVRWGSSVVLVGGGAGGQPVVEASTLSAARPVPGRGQKAFESLAEYLSSPAGQEALQAATGLAPATASARAADAQASEARAAASGSVVVQGLSRDGFAGAAARAEFAGALRRYLLSRLR